MQRLYELGFRGQGRPFWTAWFGWTALFLILGCAAGWDALGAEVIPLKPEHYFNDYASVVSQATAQRLNKALEDFERTSSCQIVVVVYPKMQSDSSIQDYTVRVAQAWGVGQKGKDNGAVLFVFIQNREMFLEVGYGLEGAIPDATAKSIIEQQIKPRFREGNFDAGLTAGVNALLQAARGEYKGTGRTVAERQQTRGRNGGGLPLLLLFLVLLVLMAAARRSQGTVYRRSGRSGWTGWRGGWIGGPWGGGGWGGGGWGSGGGGGWSSGGGGFSGGGGSFGGGGAGGSW